ncbi:hypothetical protein AKJ65_03970 [candidate division MSBL1 archaeon SCGC-AAA259E19]|uniref:Uncharacterized protein n=1 Tax=candidate division MSBL1 archaeon SCGC-AAA259E19 TaxID=1698264 RepID=A0A133UK66_9EURY|nr:hypothetical protein AKJ65_03970 [candidate division MSBL1 archaeon SCGC-AAA259E19]
MLSRFPSIFRTRFHFFTHSFGKFLCPSQIFFVRPAFLDASNELEEEKIIVTSTGKFADIILMVGLVLSCAVPRVACTAFSAAVPASFAASFPAVSLSSPRFPEPNLQRKGQRPHSSILEFTEVQNSTKDLKF